MHVHHPPQKSGDSYHVVSLTSSTLGSLKLDPPSIHTRENEDRPNHGLAEVEDYYSTIIQQNVVTAKSSHKEEFAMGMIEVKAWSKMIDEKIPKINPKTPIRTPPGEPETINAWEMMEGLEDISPLRQVNRFRSFSFHVPPNHNQPSMVGGKEEDDDENASSKPSSTDSYSNDTSVVSEFDPEVITAFRKTFDDLPPDNSFSLNPNKARSDKLIVYFTSLRGVRKTHEDCCHVRAILKTLGVKVDERDVSMHSGFKDELKQLLGEGFGGRCLPIVFIGKECIGGAEEIRQLNEEGRLLKLVERCETVDEAGLGDGNPNMCEACGDVRFVPCETCSGSCKIYYEGDYDNDDEFDSEQECGFQRCPDCNENGLIRCPICCA